MAARWHWAAQSSFQWAGWRKFVNATIMFPVLVASFLSPPLPFPFLSFPKQRLEAVRREKKQANCPLPLLLQAGDKHYHPSCARCSRCNQMFTEGEEMYLQGKAEARPEHIPPTWRERTSLRSVIWMFLKMETFHELLPTKPKGDLIPQCSSTWQLICWQWAAEAVTQWMFCFCNAWRQELEFTAKNERQERKSTKGSSQPTPGRGFRISSEDSGIFRHATYWLDSHSLSPPLLSCDPVRLFMRPHRALWTFRVKNTSSLVNWMMMWWYPITVTVTEHERAQSQFPKEKCRS